MKRGREVTKRVKKRERGESKREGGEEKKKKQERRERGRRGEQGRQGREKTVEWGGGRREKREHVKGENPIPFHASEPGPDIKPSCEAGGHQFRPKDSAGVRR